MAGYAVQSVHVGSVRQLHGGVHGQDSGAGLGAAATYTGERADRVYG